MQRILAS